MNIRRIGPADWQAFREIRLEALRLEPQAFASTYADSADRGEAEWRKAAESTHVYLVFVAGAPQAIMGLWPQADPEVAVLIMVYVKAAYRGTGLAQKLLEHVLADAANSGISKVMLHAEPSNAAAIRFYQSAGFEQSGTAARPDGDLNQPRDLVMTRTLSA